MPFLHVVYTGARKVSSNLIPTPPKRRDFSDQAKYPDAKLHREVDLLQHCLAKLEGIDGVDASDLKRGAADREAELIERTITAARNSTQAVRYDHIFGHGVMLLRSGSAS